MVGDTPGTCTPIGLGEASQGMPAVGNCILGPQRRTRSFQKRIQPKVKLWPSMAQAGNYSCHAALPESGDGVGGGGEGSAAWKRGNQMKKMPTDDDCFGPGRIREDGRNSIRCIFFKVKKPSESKSGMGPLQADRHHAGRAGVPSAGGGWLFVHQSLRGALIMSRLFGAMRQVGIVVRDIEGAMRHWIEVCGVGPWFYTDRLALTAFTYDGKRYDDLHASIALANSGDVQLELIQQRVRYSQHVSGVSRGRR